MKKALIFTLTALIIFQLSSCGIENIPETNISEQMQETTSEEVNNSETSEDNIKSQLAQFSVEKIPEWDYKVETTEPVKEKIFPYKGNDRTLIYDETRTSSYYFEAFDCYIDEDTGDRFTFINGTSKFASYMVWNIEEKLKEEDELKTEDELLKIAKEEASKYTYISEYTSKIACPMTILNHLKNEKFHIYFISFFRMLEGLKTSEEIRIGISEYGLITSIAIYHDNLYDNCFVPEYDKEAAEKELIKKAIDECGLTEDQITETNIEFQDCRISAERKLMLVYNITFTLISDIEAYPSVKSVELAITIDADCYK